MTSPPAKTVAIVQSNYIPWKGYFDLIDRVDEFILYDDAQYTRRDWRNRNRIKTPQGPTWLTIPVRVKGRYHQAVHETEIADPKWAEKHWRTIRLNYTKAPFFDRYRTFFEELYLESREDLLSEVNHRFLSALSGVLGIETELTWSMDYELTEEDSTRKLVELCVQAGASRYLSGPAAREYMDEEEFARHGIEVEYMNYEGYPEYDQPNPPFEHAVSVVDLLLCTGPEALAAIRRE